MVTAMKTSNLTFINEPHTIQIRADRVGSWRRYWMAVTPTVHGPCALLVKHYVMETGGVEV
jgi:hypothetical protein